MSPKFIGFVIFVWVVGSILGGVLEQVQLGSSQEGVLANLTSWQQITTSESWGPWAMVTFVPNFFNSLWNMLTFNFAFIQGPMVYVKWIILAPLIGMLVYGAIITLIGIFQRSLS